MSKRRPAIYDGFIVVDKPIGMTSHDVVATVRKAIGERRVGHAGTLDPDAAGVLVVGVGTATRMLRFLSPLEKRYVGELVLGTSTSTLDASGQVLERFDMSHVTIDDVRKAAEAFVGEIEQIPPMVSAVKVDGKRLYKLARDGSEVDRPLRPVTVTQFDVTPTDDDGVFKIEVTCSSGTYVRSLAADVGTALGGGAHLRALSRTAVGPFGLREAIPLDKVAVNHIRPVAAIVAHLDHIVVDDIQRDQVAHGVVFDAAALGASGEGPWALVDKQDELIAIYESWRGSRAKPAIVLVTAN